MVLADENFPIASVRLLRTSGLDDVAVIEESPGISDAAILQRAEHERRILLTFDRDYGELIFRQRLGRPSMSYIFAMSPIPQASQVSICSSCLPSLGSS